MTMTLEQAVDSVSRRFTSGAASMVNVRRDEWDAIGAHLAGMGEPVAVIGRDWEIFYAGGDAIADIVKRHGLQIGSKLYAAPPASGDWGAVREVLKELRLFEAVSDEETKSVVCSIADKLTAALPENPHD